MPHPLLTLKDVGFSFETHKPVVDRVSFSLRPGEILGIAGENGAGKTTLARLITGELTPDQGEIIRSSDLDAPQDFRVSLVPQHPVLAPDLRVWENLILGREETGLFQAFSLKKIKKRINATAKILGFSFDLEARASSLSASLQQKVALVSAFLQTPTLLILDEPTSSLPPAEARDILETIKGLAQVQKLGVLLISHRLEELFFLCDRIIILQEGRVLEEISRKDFSYERLSELMVASGIPTEGQGRKMDGTPPATSSSPILRVENLHSSNHKKNPLINITFDLFPGEILGFAGIREEGLDTLEDLISGLTPWTSGSLTLNGFPVKSGSPRGIRRLGLGYVPWDRMNRGSIPGASVLDNLIPHQIGNLSEGWILHPRKTLPFFKISQEVLSFKGEPHQKLQELSGGNIQRVILSRELETNPAVLLLSEPSWGLDLKSRRILHDLLRTLRSQGRSILILSSDLGELLDLSDRLGVIHGGKLLALKPIHQWTGPDLDKAILGIL